MGLFRFVPANLLLQIRAAGGRLLRPGLGLGCNLCCHADPTPPTQICHLPHCSQLRSTLLPSSPSSLTLKKPSKGFREHKMLLTGVFFVFFFCFFWKPDTTSGHIRLSGPETAFGPQAGVWRPPVLHICISQVWLTSSSDNAIWEELFKFYSDLLAILNPCNKRSGRGLTKISLDECDFMLWNVLKALTTSGHF